MRPLPSTANSTSAHVRAAASERRRPASDSKLHNAISTCPRWATQSGASGTPRRPVRGSLADARIASSAAASRAVAWTWGCPCWRLMPFNAIFTTGLTQGMSPSAALCVVEMAAATNRTVATDFPLRPAAPGSSRSLRARPAPTDWRRRPHRTCSRPAHRRDEYCRSRQRLWLSAPVRTECLGR